MIASCTSSLATDLEILNYRNSVASAFVRSGWSAGKFLRRNPQIVESKGTIREWARRHDPKNRWALADLRWFVTSREPAKLSGLVLAVIWVLRDMYFVGVPVEVRRLNASDVREEIVKVWEAAAEEKLVAPWNATLLPAASSIREVIRDFERYTDRLGPAEHEFRDYVLDRYDCPPKFRNYLWKTDSVQFSRRKLARFRAEVIFENRGGVNHEVDCWATQTIDVGSRYSLRASCYNSRPTAPDIQIHMRDCMMPSVDRQSHLHGRPQEMRFDQGGEHCIEQLLPALEMRLGIRLRYTPPGAPKMNSHVERLHRTLLAILKLIFLANPGDIQTVTMADGQQVRGIEYTTFVRRVAEARQIYNRRERPAFRNESPISAWLRMKDPKWESQYNSERIRRGFYEEFRNVEIVEGRMTFGDWIYEDADLEPFARLHVRELLGDEYHELEFHSKDGRVCSLRPLPWEDNR